jgi:WD40 repeat protein
MSLWTVPNRKPKPLSRRHWSALHDLAFSSDGQRLVAAGNCAEGLVQFWDVVTGRDVLALPGESGWYCRIGFSPDGATLYAASFEGTALLWHAPSLNEIEANQPSR